MSLHKTRLVLDRNGERLVLSPPTYIITDFKLSPITKDMSSVNRPVGISYVASRYNSREITLDIMVTSGSSEGSYNNVEIASKAIDTFVGPKEVFRLVKQEYRENYNNVEDWYDTGYYEVVSRNSPEWSSDFENNNAHFHKCRLSLEAVNPFFQVSMYSVASTTANTVYYFKPGEEEMQEYSVGRIDEERNILRYFDIESPTIDELQAIAYDISMPSATDPVDYYFIGIQCTSPTGTNLWSNSYKATEGTGFQNDKFQIDADHPVHIDLKNHTSYAWKYRDNTWNKIPLTAALLVTAMATDPVVQGNLTLRLDIQDYSGSGGATVLDGVVITFTDSAISLVEG